MVCFYIKEENIFNEISKVLRKLLAKATYTFYFYLL